MKVFLRVLLSVHGNSVDPKVLFIPSPDPNQTLTILDVRLERFRVGGKAKNAGRSHTC